MKKKFLRRSICVITALIIMCSCSITAFANDPDLGYVALSFENAPEGTEFIEILVPIAQCPKHMTEFHEYIIKRRNTYYKSVDVIVTDQYGRSKTEQHSEKIKEETKDIAITEDSEIAQYRKDGYISLCAYTDMVISIGSYSNFYNGVTEDSEANLLLAGSYSAQKKNSKNSDVDIYYLESEFSDMKAAYIDKDGNILGVTDKYEVDKHASRYSLRADGNKLILGFDDYSHWFTFRFFTRLIIPVLLFAAVVILFIKWIVQGTIGSKE